ncbi:MAG: hypothetical protein EOM76_08590 [Sphingobacteriia bacterium]|nr:hypothetical protein [Sphingobacteriia bacterium]
MKINFNLCEIDEIKKDLESIRSFKDRWISLISGWRNINDDEEDLKRTQTILEAELVLENILFAMEEAEALNAENTKP